MGETGAFRLADVELDESIGRSTPDVEHERAVAIFDLIEENRFEPVGHGGGPYCLKLSLVDMRLVFAISTQSGAEVATHILSLTPFRRIVSHRRRPPGLFGLPPRVGDCSTDVDEGSESILKERAELFGVVKRAAKEGRPGRRAHPNRHPAPAPSIATTPSQKK